MSALAGIDQALWDIAGKHYGAPSHQLARGARFVIASAFMHIGGIGSMTDEGESCRERPPRNVTAKRGDIRRLSRGPGGTWRAHEPPAVIDAFVERAYLMREWVGAGCGVVFRLSRQNDTGARD